MSLVGKKGVDISSNNGSVDIAKIKKAGYDFVIIRCGFGEDIKSQDDNRWEENVKKCEAAGMPWGAYFYSYACSESSAKSELTHALRLLKGKKPTLPVAFDMEDADGYKARHGGWNKTNVDRTCRIFLEGIAKAGYYPMLYAGFEEMNNLISSEVWNKYDVWFPHWASKCGYNGKNLSMWQYGGETNILESNSIPGVGVIARRKEAGKAYSSATVLSSKLICEDCGGFFGIKVWHSTDKYRRVIYRCNNKYANKTPCRTNHFTEEEVHKMFLAAYNEYMGNRENIIRGAEKMCRVLSDTTDLTRKLEQKTAQRETKAELYRAWISQGAGVRSDNFKKHEEKLYADYDAVDKEVNALTQKLADINNRHTKLVNYIKGLQEKPLILENGETARWITTIRH